LVIAYRLVIAFLAACYPLLAQAVGAEAPRRAAVDDLPIIAEVHVLEDRVRVLLEVDPEALQALEGRPAGSGAMGSDAGRSQRTAGELLGELLEIRDGTGRVLAARPRLIQARGPVRRSAPFAGLLHPAGGQAAPQRPAERSIHAEIDYSFDDMRPDRLFFAPPVDPLGRALVPMGVLVYHQSVPVTDFHRLPGEVRLALSWADPWRSRFDLPELARQRRDVLSHFLYVEREELRHEILIRLDTLADWMDLGLADPRLVYPEEVPLLKERVAGFFAERNPLFADALRLSPTSVETRFVELTPSGVRPVKTDERMEVPPAVLGVILTFPMETIPEEIIVGWRLFSERNREVPAVSIDPAGPRHALLTLDDPVLVWSKRDADFGAGSVEPIAMEEGRRLGLPIPSLVLFSLAAGCLVLAWRWPIVPRWRLLAMAGGGMLVAATLYRVGVVQVANPLTGPPGERRAEAIVEGLAANLHYAAWARDGAAREQALAASVDVRSLSSVLLEVRRALSIEVADGIPARVERLEDVAIEARDGYWPGSAFTAQASWSAVAGAAHWGSEQKTRVRFDVEVDLDLIDGLWKVTSFRVIDAEPKG
jgi:hypothetical protein